MKQKIKKGVNNMKNIGLYIPLILMVLGQLLITVAMALVFGWVFGLFVLGIQFMTASYSLQDSRRGN